MKIFIIICLLFSSINLISQWESVNKRSGLLIAYNNKLYIISDSVFISENQGISWKSFNFEQIYQLNEYSYIVGNSENIIMPEYENNFFVSNDNGFSFTKNDYSSLGFKELKSVSISDYKFTTAPIQNMVVISASSSKMLFSVDNGKNWTYNLYDFYESFSENNTISYTTPTILSTHFTESTLFAGGTRSFYKLVKHPITYDSLFLPIYSNFPIEYQNMNIIDIAGNDKYLYVLLTKGSHVGYSISYLLKSNNLGESWELIETEQYGIDRAKYIYTCGNYLYLIQKDLGLLTSSDYGKNWAHLNSYKDDYGFKEFTYPRWLEFGKDFAYISNNGKLYKAPLKNCQIVADFSSVDSYEKQEVKIYPNPANETVAISGINNGNVEIFNSIGQLLINSEIQGTSNINTSTLHPGIYLLKIEHGNEVTFEKLIINK